MKIIGGDLKGRKLTSITKNSIRPTSARVKEVIFNIISNKIKGVKILDLFAGTGNLGIESISRGAKKAVFVENKKENLKKIKLNIDKLNIKEKTLLFNKNIIKNLNFLKNLNFKFEIVFIDPPYNKNMIEPTINNLLEINILTKNACIIIERDVKECLTLKALDKFFKIKKKIGNTNLIFFHL